MPDNCQIAAGDAPQPHDWKTSIGDCHRPNQGHEITMRCLRCGDWRVAPSHSVHVVGCSKCTPISGGANGPVIIDPIIMMDPYSNDHDWRTTTSDLHVLKNGHAWHNRCGRCYAEGSSGDGIRAAGCARCHLASPILVEPSENAGLLIQSVVIRWNPVEGRESYRLTLEDRDTRKKIYSDHIITQEHMSIPADLLVPGHEYRVGVRAVSDMPEAPAPTAQRSFRVQVLAITELRDLEVTTRSARIEWKTNYPADSTISIYCSDEGLEQGPTHADHDSGKTVHSFKVEGLKDGRAYKATILCVQGAGPTAEGEISFTTFKISSVYVRPTTGTSARLDFVTNKLCRAEVIVSDTQSSKIRHYESSEQRTSHAFELDGLDPSTTYVAQIRCHLDAVLVGTRTSEPFLTFPR